MPRVKRIHILISLAFITSVFLTIFKAPLASSQGLTLFVTPLEGALPVDNPTSELWRQATAVEIPLSAQNITKPLSLETRVKSVTARALQNDTQIAILVEWADGTQNDSMVRPQDFRDAVALQFPLAEGQPFFCMGQLGGNVNLWHWKADWQHDLIARQDMDSQYPNMYVDYYPFADPEAGIQAGVADYQDANYVPALEAGNLFANPVHFSPVEDLVAGGFGTLTAQPAEGQNVSGYGEWVEGKWRVIFSRDLASAEADDVNFAPGKVYSMAFAVWDGANQERNGQKSTSQWVSLQLASAPPPAGLAEAQAPSTWFTPYHISLILWGVLILLFLIGALIYSRLPE